MFDLLQKNFAPFSLRSVRTVRAGAADEWAATICVNGAAVGKLITLPETDGEAGESAARAEDSAPVYAMDLCFTDDCHQTHFEQHTQALMRAGVLVEQDLHNAMVDLLTLMADAYLGDKAMFRLAKDGETIFRLRSDPINAYRRSKSPYSPTLGQELKLRYEDVEWVLNERLGSHAGAGAPVLQLASSSNGTRH